LAKEDDDQPVAHQSAKEHPDDKENDPNSSDPGHGGQSGANARNARYRQNARAVLVEPSTDLAESLGRYLGHAFGYGLASTLANLVIDELADYANQAQKYDDRPKSGI
jgi:hypothetical protein